MRGGDHAQAPPADGHSLDGRLAGLSRRLDRLAERQASVLREVTGRAVHGAGRWRAAIRLAGLDPARFAGPPPGLGGPFVPVPAAASASEETDGFDLALARAQASTRDERRLARAVDALPLRRPVLGEAVYTSGFGTRADPFTHGLALHTGLDLRAEPGTPARAAAAGRVTAAEYAGGYGNMVEIDHGHGILTRYAHLARLSVAPGQPVAAGAVIGRIGSTGRSTGPHLHYETRIDGEPVDPMRFLRAGASLQAGGPVAEADEGALSGEGWQAWVERQVRALGRPR